MVIKMDTHEQIIALIEQYKFENEKFISKQNKSAGIRARKILMEISLQKWLLKVEPNTH